MPLDEITIAGAWDAVSRLDSSTVATTRNRSVAGIGREREGVVGPPQACADDADLDRLVSHTGGRSLASAWVQKAPRRACTISLGEMAVRDDGLRRSDGHIGERILDYRGQEAPKPRHSHYSGALYAFRATPQPCRFERDVSTHCTIACSSASGTAGFGGVGMSPHTPAPPSRTFCSSTCAVASSLTTGTHSELIMC